jgi:uncharacterized membrane protein YsdA (DUF1294 family)/cold shock CspA family protein
VRFEGRLKTWTDDRGFGFIEPNQGGQEIFVHIKAFPAGSGRPREGQRLSFEIEVGAQGKKRAKNVQFVRALAVRRGPRREAPAHWGVASALAVPAFVAIAVWAALTWHVPAWAALVYVGASGVCFLAYALDKAAARRGAWRTPESTLLMLGLLGGWPGGLLAQQLLRHKSNKTSFRAAFWGTVMLNAAGFVLLASRRFA